MPVWHSFCPGEIPVPPHWSVSIDRFHLRLVASRQRHGFEASADGAALPEPGGLGAKKDRATGDADLDRANAIAETLLNLALDAPPDRSFGDGVGSGLDLDRRGGLACLFRGVPRRQEPAHEGRRVSRRARSGCWVGRRLGRWLGGAGPGLPQPRWLIIPGTV